MRIFIWIQIILITIISPASVTATNLICNSENKPQVINPLQNWEIIAGNVAHIKITNTFKGKDLIYKLSVPKNIKNEVIINQKIGEITINAETKDNFDVQVIAKNSCGSVSNTFNVIIDEEE